MRSMKAEDYSPYLKQQRAYYSLYQHTMPILDYGGQVYNVLAYGATGDGTTDDTAAVLAILTGMTAGGILFFPVGTYLLSTDLLGVSNIWALGAGWKSILKLKTSSTNVANAIKLSNVQNVMISNLTIDGNKSNINQSGAGATYTQKQAIYITGGSSNITVRDCYIHDCFAGGIVADSASKLYISNNRCDANGDNAIFLRPAPADQSWTAPSNVTIANNIVSNGTYSGIGIIKASYVTANANIVYGNAPLGGTNGQGSGFTVEGSDNCTIAGNVVHDNGVNGIDLRYSDEGNPANNLPASHCAVTGNQVYNNGYGSGNGNAGGIITEGVDDVTIQGNNCYHNDNGINISSGNALDPKHVTVQGNICRSNAVIGLRFFTNGAAVDLVADGNYVENNGSDQFTANCKVLLKGGLIARPTTAGKENVHLLTGSSGSIVDGVKMTDPIDNCVVIDDTVTGTILRNCIFDKASGSGGRGVYEANTAGAATLIENCKFMNFTFESYKFNNTNSIARHNDVDQDGFYDTNSGSASVAAASSTIAVTHNMYKSPARIQLTPTADTQGLRWYVSARTATTFTITLNSNAVTNPVTFDWRAFAWDK
jgi:parallel beta-helix repeat protein